MIMVLSKVPCDNGPKPGPPVTVVLRSLVTRFPSKVPGDNVHKQGPWVKVMTQRVSDYGGPTLILVTVVSDNVP